MCPLSLNKQPLRKPQPRFHNTRSPFLMCSTRATLTDSPDLLCVCPLTFPPFLSSLFSSLSLSLPFFFFLCLVLFVCSSDGPKIFFSVSYVQKFQKFFATHLSLPHFTFQLLDLALSFSSLPPCYLRHSFLFFLSLSYVSPFPLFTLCW